MFPHFFPQNMLLYGMLTIKGTFGSLYVLGIPNNNARKQYDKLKERKGGTERKV